MTPFWTGFAKQAAAATKANTAIGSLPGVRSGITKAPSPVGIPNAMPKANQMIASRATPPPLPTPTPSKGATPALVAPKLKTGVQAPTATSAPSRVTGRGVPSMAV